MEIINKIDQFNAWVGKSVSYLTFILVILVSIEVFGRYVFGQGPIWMKEVQTYLFSWIFLWGSAYALQKNQHIRVDVFYERFSEKGKAWVDFLGTALFLLPWCIIILWISFQMSMISFGIKETSAQAGGLPAVYLLKFSVFIGFLLLFLQAISQLLKAFLVLFHSQQTEQ